MDMKSTDRLDGAFGDDAAEAAAPGVDVLATVMGAPEKGTLGVMV
jgi:hypothetical protein